MIAVIMAGGFGTRLRPLTYSIPKPLLPVGEKPILEIIIGKLKDQGIREIYIITGYRSELIQTYFGNGLKFGVRISYIQEEKPLGTAGSLVFLKNRLKNQNPFLVMNGDILTRLNFNKMQSFHLKKKADITVGTKKHTLKLPFGILQLQDRRIMTIHEKPSFVHQISAGIYMLKSHILSLIPRETPFTMPDLLARAIARNCQVVSYPISEYWLAIEQMDQFSQALSMKRKWD